MTPELYIAGAAIGVNIGALVVSVLSIVASTKKSVRESEERITGEIRNLDVRAATLETKVDRAEKDIQNIFHVIPKRTSDKARIAYYGKRNTRSYCTLTTWHGSC